jgi:nicotinamide riboside kinase
MNQNKSKSTLIVNLISGPGTGKSTMSGGLFYRMKRTGINCEYIQEYAKDKTWSEDKQTLLCQPYVTGKQFYRTSRLLNKVEVAVTDSPVITGILYQGFGCTPSWEKWAIEAFNEFNNLNIFLVRNTKNHPYNPKGRSQKEEEAIEKDNEARAILDKYNIPYEVVEISDVDTETWKDPGLDEIYKLVINRLILSRLEEDASDNKMEICYGETPE